MAEQQHRATAGEWASVKACADDVVTYSCILELLHRIEALEAKDEGDTEAWAARLRRPGRSQGERINSLVKRIEALEATDSKWASIKARAVLEVAQPAESNHPEIPDSSLMGQVAAVIENGTACDRDPRRMAGDVIREVADWLREHYGGPTATTDLLEEKAEQ